MLVVRDLMPGPRRFTDLFDGLPGVSTDLLTDRLRTLEEAGAVVRRKVTAPVPGSVYELTPRGRELGKIGHELARWGMPLLPTYSETSLRANARWALQSMAGNSAGLPGLTIVHFVIDGNDLTLTIDPDGASIAYGFIGDPAITVTANTADFFKLRSRLLAGRLEVGDGVEVSGDLEQLASIMQSLPLMPEAS